MKTFILIAVAIFFVSVITGFIYNKKKEKKYEEGLPEDVVKTKKLYKGSVVRYVFQEEGKTIVRYFLSGRTNTLKDFVPNDEILINKSLILFDKKREKVAIIRDIENHGSTQIIPFDRVISLQPVEVSKRKKVTRGCISPISIGGYRWASVTTKNLKQIERIYIEIKYRAYDKDNTYEITVFDGISYEDQSKYTHIVDEVNKVINKFHTIIAK